RREPERAHRALRRAVTLRVVSTLERHESGAVRGDFERRKFRRWNRDDERLALTVWDEELQRSVSTGQGIVIQRWGAEECCDGTVDRRNLREDHGDLIRLVLGNILIETAIDLERCHLHVTDCRATLLHAPVEVREGRKNRAIGDGAVDNSRAGAGQRLSAESREARGHHALGRERKGRTADVEAAVAQELRQVRMTILGTERTKISKIEAMVIETRGSVHLPAVGAVRIFHPRHHAGRVALGLAVPFHADLAGDDRAWFW